MSSHGRQDGETPFACSAKVRQRPLSVNSPVLAERRLPERIKRVKKYILFDHDGVLVDTEFWYYKAGDAPWRTSV